MGWNYMEHWVYYYFMEGNGMIDKEGEVILMKQSRQYENTCKAKDARQGSYFNVTLEGVTLKFCADSQTQSDLISIQGILTAGTSQFPYLDEDCEEFLFTSPEQPAECLKALVNIHNKVDRKEVEYSAEIEAAQTLEELEAIVIDYTLDGE